VVPDHDRAWPLVSDHNSACCWYRIITVHVVGTRSQQVRFGTGCVWYRIQTTAGLVRRYQIMTELVQERVGSQPNFFRLLSKAAYTPCHITTNHCRIVLMDILLIFATITIQFRFSFHNCKCENISFIA
jgi:hypothetical protein